MLFNEIEFANRVSFPNSMLIFDQFRDENKYYVVRELVQNSDGTKADTITDYVYGETVFTEHQTSVIVAQILQLLKHLKQLKIAHRDLKPRNILIRDLESDYPNIKVFGWSAACTQGLRISGNDHLCA